MLAVVAVGISVYGKNGVDVPAHLGQVFGVSRTVGVLRKVGAKAVDIRSIHIRYIVVIVSLPEPIWWDVT